jgi:hypothetical protein
MPNKIFWLVMTFVVVAAVSAPAIDYYMAKRRWAYKKALLGGIPVTAVTAGKYVRVIQVQMPDGSLIWVAESDLVVIE